MPSQIQTLIDKASDYDKDERFMATSDLCNLLSKDTQAQLDPSLERRICACVLSRLDDSSNDVQSIAVKCLGVLLVQVREDSIFTISDKLITLILTGNAELRDIYSIGLKKLIQSVPDASGVRVAPRLTPRLLGGIEQDKELGIKIECLDCLDALLKRFGTKLALQTSHETVMSKTLSQLSNPSTVVRKKSTAALGTLAVVVNDTLLFRLVETLMTQIKDGASSDKAKAHTLIKAMCQISSTVGYRLGKQLHRIVPIFEQFTDFSAAGFTADGERDEEVEEPDNEDVTNELRESCFNGFSSFVTRCPVEVKSHLSGIVKTSSTFIKFDPNYTYDSDSDSDEEKGSDDDSDMSNDEDDYSDADEEYNTDDDDSSWKVRYAAVNALGAAIASQKDNLSLLWEMNCLDTLLGRFKEREENVRVEVINAFSEFIKFSISSIASAANRAPAVGSNGDVEMMDVDEESKYDSPVYMLSSLQKKTPQIIKACVKLLKVKTKSDRSKTAILALLSTICNAPGGLGEPKAVNAVMGAMDITLSPSASKAIKLDSLLFLQSALKCEKGGHLPSTVQPHVLTILPLVQSAAAEDWYKIIAEAIRVFSLVPALITARDSKDSMSDSPPVDTDTTQKAADIIFASVEPRLKENDIDQEIKETSIVAMGELVTTLGNLLSSDQISTVLSLLLERLGNEITRTAALKTLGKIASSPLKIDISSILSEATEQLAHFLRQNSRSLKLCVLETISSLVQSNNNKMAPSLFDLILTEAAPLITDADLQISHLAVNVSYDVLVSSKDSFKAIKSTTLPPLIVLASSPLLQGLALNSTTKFLEELSIAGSSEVTFSEISAALYAAVDSETRQQAMSNLSKCIAAICAVADSNLQEEVLKDLVVDVNGADKLKRRLGLLTIGALGERVDLSSVPKLGDILLAAFSNEDDQTKAAAAFALGHVSVRAIDVFLPVILDALNNGTSIYLVLSSLKELIVCAISNGLEVESKYVDQIMPHLVTFCEDEAEGVRSMAAECMGCFITMKPKQVLPVLKSLGESKMDGSEKSNLVLWTVATSVRNALGSKNVDLAALTEHMSGFLEYLKSEDFAVRTATLLMVNAAVWYQNTVITAQMEDVVLPALLTLLELKVIRTIDLGPFKHKVDDALPLRKACISIIDSALTRCPGVLPVASILPKLASCLTDESDVVLSCHQLIIKFTKLHPALVAQNVPLFLSSGLEKTINKKIKDGASANDREKAEELIKSAMRVAAEWQRIDDVHGSATFGEFVERIKAKDNLELIWNEVLRNR